MSDQDKKEQEIEVSEAPTIFFDFARRYHSSQWCPLYRIGSSGTMYPSDLDFVEKQIKQARQSLDKIDERTEEDREWSETLMVAEDEVRSLKRKYC